MKKSILINWAVFFSFTLCTVLSFADESEEGAEYPYPALGDTVLGRKIVGDDEAQTCWNKYKHGKESMCNPQKNPELAQTGMVVDNMIKSLGSMGGGGTNIACSNLGKILEAANGASAAFKLGCKMIQGTCLTECQAAYDIIKSRRDDLNKVCGENDSSLVAQLLRLHNLRGNQEAYDQLKNDMQPMIKKQLNLLCGNVDKYGSIPLLPESMKGAVCGNSEELFKDPGASSSAIRTYCKAELDVQKERISNSTAVDDGNVVRAKSTCTGWGQVIADVGQNMLGVAGTLANAQMCDQQSSAKDNNANAANSSYCVLYPATPICQQIADYCSQAANASTATCVCKKDPSSSACISVSKPGTGGLGGSSTDSGSGLGTASDVDLKPDKWSGLPESANIAPVQGKPGAGGTTGIGGGGGAGLMSVGGGGGGGNRGGGGGAGPGHPTNIDKGFSSSGGGSRGGGYRDSSGKDGGSGKDKKPGINLADYLPGGKNDPRKAVGADGITGAMGPSLWEKVSTRYRANQPSLQP